MFIQYKFSFCFLPRTDEELENDIPLSKNVYDEEKHETKDVSRFLNFNFKF